MDMDSAAVFLAGTILYAIGGIVILIAVVIANNIIHKFWKSFGWKLFPELDLTQKRFAEPHELDKSTESTVK